MEKEELAFNLLADKICKNCKYSFKSSIMFLSYKDGQLINRNENLDTVICDYENIAIYRKKGMEFAMNTVKNINDTCEKWEERK